MKRFILLHLFLCTFLLSESHILDILKNEYYRYEMNTKFDRYTDQVMNEYKNDISYFDKVLANNGLGAEDQAKEITNKVFRLYTPDFDRVIKTILHNDLLSKEIKKNYDLYIKESSSVIEQKVGQVYKEKFLDIYNSETLKAVLRNDINENIKATEKKILDKVKQDVVDEQITVVDMVVGAVVLQVISNIGKLIVERIGIQVGLRLGSRVVGLIPYIGWVIVGVMTIYDAATVNDLYDDMGKEIKIAFHQNENMILNETANILSDIDNISLSYKANLLDISTDYIIKTKVMHEVFSSDINKEKKILKLNNYLYVKTLDAVYKVPENYQKYIITKLLHLNDQSKELFLLKLNKLDDIYTLYNIMSLNNKFDIDYSVDDFFAAADFFDTFYNKEDAKTFFNFANISTSNLSLKNLQNLREPYEVLKGNLYLQKKYGQMDRTQREELLKLVESKETDFGKIAYFEKVSSFEVPTQDFLEMIKTINKFPSTHSIDSSIAEYRKYIEHYEYRTLKEYIQKNTSGKYYMIALDFYRQQTVFLLLFFLILSALLTISLKSIRIRSYFVKKPVFSEKIYALPNLSNEDKINDSQKKESSHVD